jgi:N-acetylgalactosamine-N,N'-diacetylbacillosaminyl-diphospho-undecaprenol 4-alpha-N-acetylgalactosaminyltransferase
VRYTRGCDCLSGPSEIIQDRNNGLLVENQNFKKLAQAMDLMIEDHDLYQFANRIRSQASTVFL